MSAQIDLHIAPRIADRGRHLRFGPRRIHAGPQPYQSRKIELADTAQLCPIEAHRLEDLRVFGKLIQGAELVSGWKAEVGPQHSNHDMRLAVELDGLADYSRI